MIAQISKQGCEYELRLFGFSDAPLITLTLHESELKARIYAKSISADIWEPYRKTKPLDIDPV